MSIGIVLSVYLPISGVTKSIKWNGTNLVLVGEQRQKCGAYDQNDGAFHPYTIENLSNPTWSDCQCLTISSSNVTRRYTGVPDSSVGTVFIDYMGEQPVEFIPHVSDFPWGFGVSTKSGSMQGNLEIQYEPLQTLYLSKSHAFVQGQTISQGSVQGAVYANTTIFLYGLQCPNSNQWGYNGECFHYINYQKDYSKCEHAKQASGQYWGNWLPKGVKLTQLQSGGDVAIGYTTDSASIGPGQGIPVVMSSGTFNTHDTIIVQQDYDENINPYGQSITGNMTWSIANHIETWPAPEILVKGNCDPGTTFIVNATGVTNAKLYGNGPWQGPSHLDWVWLDNNNPGTNCDSSNLKIHVYPVNGHCSVLPVIKAKCSKRIESFGSSVIVLLNSANSPFVSGPQIRIGSNDLDGTYVYWTNNEKGNIVPPTGDTKLVFQTRSTVQADANDIPVLYCYDNCPNAADNNFQNCANSNQPNMGGGNGNSQKSDCYKSYPTKLDKSVGTGQAGSCTKKPTYTFSEIEGSPTINITWTTSKNSSGTGTLYGISSIAVLDPGKNCDPSTTPTLTFVDNGGDCTTLPSGWTLTCVQGNDVSDFRQAHPYSFSATTGLLTDTENEHNIIINAMSNGNGMSSKSYGPFFEPPTNANKNEILCDYDKSQVCSWKIYQSSTFTYYYYETGPGAYRASLLTPGTNSVVKISKQLDLLYTHQGHSSNSGTDYDGSSFLLTYNGPSQLTGFAYICLDPDTFERVPYCTPSNYYGATVSLPDININREIPLSDISGTNYYYALPSTIKEYYPKASSNSLCNGLNLTHLPVLTPFDEFFQTPSNQNQGIPTSADLTANYLNGGKPVVVKGQTLRELSKATNF